MESFDFSSDSILYEILCFAGGQVVVKEFPNEANSSAGAVLC